jgi:hypothetical protein
LLGSEFSIGQKAASDDFLQLGWVQALASPTEELSVSATLEKIEADVRSFLLLQH